MSPELTYLALRAEQQVRFSDPAVAHRAAIRWQRPPHWGLLRRITQRLARRSRQYQVRPTSATLAAESGGGA